MYQALYRKYRPKDFSDVCGQDRIVSTLKNQIRSDKVSHAYLFCGSRGTGKTTCAKILAKAVNCESPRDGEPCNECDSCRMINDGTTIDVVEIDAASNNGVDSIRQLCDEVKYMPSEMKKRVYIIDEVHMLTTAAFNALLKTLEEPPEHILFILATTEQQKIPLTISSRCQCLNFKRIPTETITGRIMSVAAAERIEIDRAAAEIIARLSDGAMRDALSLLESCIGKTEFITAEEITTLLGLSGRELLSELCLACASKNAARCASLINDIYEKQGDLKTSLSELMKLYRDILVIKNVPSPRVLVECSDAEWQKLSEISDKMSNDLALYQLSVLQPLIAGYDYISSGKRASVEIAFIKMCRPADSTSYEALCARLEELETSEKSGVIAVKSERYDADERKDDASDGEEASTSKDETPDEALPEGSGDLADSASPEATPASETKPAPEEKTISDTGSDKVRTKPEKARDASVSSVFRDKKRLFELLADEAMMLTFLNDAAFTVVNNILTVSTEPFVCDMLRSIGAEETVLAAYKKINPEAVAVKIVSGTKKEKTDILDTLM